VPNTQFGNWWPADLGVPGSTGAQNNLRYAYFPGARRLAIDVSGQISVYDTGNSKIDCGIVRPSALAVLRLMISSIFVDCCTGRSDNLMGSTKDRN
jgi:hypothetical protein